nr:ubiquitin hydrolase [Tanacetum cinerariifolium]
MVKTSSSLENKACCSKSCKKNTESLNTHPPTVAKSDKKETIRKPSVKYAEQYKNPSKTSNVRGNQRNWNNLKSQQLGENFVMKNRACFNCCHFDHLSYSCGKWVDHGRSWEKNNNTHKSMPPRPAIHKPNRSPMRPTRPNTNVAPRSNVNNARPKTTQDLMIILIQRVKRLERELKARTPHIKIHKGNSVTKLEDSVRTKRSRGSKSTEVVDYILQVKKKLLTKKLKDSEAEHQV